MFGLNRIQKITCDNCGTQTTKKKIVRHKARCSAGTLYCTQRPNFSTTSQADMNYGKAKKHSKTRLKNKHKCKICSKSFLASMRCENTKQMSMELR